MFPVEWTFTYMVRFCRCWGPMAWVPLTLWGHWFQWMFYHMIGKLMLGWAFYNNRLFLINAANVEKERDPDEANFSLENVVVCVWMGGKSFTVKRVSLFCVGVVKESNSHLFFSTGKKVENCQNFAISSSWLLVLQDGCIFLYFVIAFSWTVYVQIIIYFKTYIVY